MPPRARPRSGRAHGAPRAVRVRRCGDARLFRPRRRCVFRKRPQAYAIPSHTNNQIDDWYFFSSRSSRGSLARSFAWPLHRALAEVCAFCTTPFELMKTRVQDGRDPGIISAFRGQVTLGRSGEMLRRTGTANHCGCFLTRHVGRSEKIPRRFDALRMFRRYVWNATGWFLRRLDTLRMFWRDMWNDLRRFSHDFSALLMCSTVFCPHGETSSVLGGPDSPASQVARLWSFGPLVLWS